MDRIKNFGMYDYTETEVWVATKYTKWVNKDSRYDLSLTGGTNISNNDKTKSWNAINNFKIALDKIATINCWPN